MSTNSIVVFTDGERTHETYKHWDGYPSSTIPLLQDFLEWVPDGRHSQTGYVTASWFYWVKARRHDFEEEIGHNSDLVLSYGARPREPVESAWIEHTYVVDLKNEEIRHHRGDPFGEERVISELEGVEPDDVSAFGEVWEA